MSGAKSNIPWDALAAYLKNGESSGQEAAVREWLEQSAENQQVFHEITQSWQISRKIPQPYQPNKELLWKKLMLRVEQKNKNTQTLVALRKWTIAAAVILVVFISGIWFGNMKSSGTYSGNFTHVVCPPGSRTQITLPDQSVVWLNSGAELRYANDLGRKSRDVFFTGECYFEVSKNSRIPFVVHSSNLNVKVFGTSFNVREDNRGQTFVSLIEGKVQVQNKSGEPLVMLAPGEQFIAVGGSGKVRNVDNIESLIAWKNGVLIFENKLFGEVVSSLENWYGVKFQVDSSMLNKHSYTFNVKTESLSEVLELISVITPIEYRIEGENVYVKYK